MRSSDTAARAGRALLAGLALLLAAVLGGVVTGGPAHATAAAAAPTVPADLVQKAAGGLSTERVYVDPAQQLLDTGEIAKIRQAVESSASPIYLAVLPPVGDPQAVSELPGQLRDRVGQRGTYAVLAGESFRAGSDVIPGSLAGQIAREAAVDNANDIPAGVAQFTERVDSAASQPNGATSGGGDVQGTRPFEPKAEQGSSSFAYILLFLLLIGGVGAFLIVRKSNQTKRRREEAELAQVRTAVDEDITSYGEELNRLEFDPAAAGVDDAMRTDYSHALDAYEHAKTAIAAARRPEDVREVTAALEDGRYSLASLAARQEGRPLPERRPPCFFDPRHGPSVQDAEWAPPGGMPRQVPVCAADAARLADGLDPMVREVEMAGGGRRPYWDAGPAYGPWAGGYFGGYGSMLLPGLLVGTLLGSSFAGPGMWAGDATGGDWFGGGESSEGDAGGGGDWFGGGGGDFGGGDFGGGGGDF